LDKSREQKTLIKAFDKKSQFFYAQIQSNKLIENSLWFIPPIKMVMTGGWFMIGL
jgi:hypothetical protein